MRGCSGREPILRADPQQAAGNGMRKPEAPQLISGPPSRACPDRLDIPPRHAAMATDGDIWQVTGITEVDDMLSRCAEQLSGFPSREEVSGVRLGDQLCESPPHRCETLTLATKNATLSHASCVSCG